MDLQEEVDDPESEATDATTASSKSGKVAKKSKKKGKKRDWERDGEVVENQYEYEEYEEDDEPIAGSTATEVNTFMVKLVELKAVMELLAPKGDAKGKKGKKAGMSRSSQTKEGGEDEIAAIEQDKVRLVSELQDEIAMEAYNTERKIEIEAEQMRLRRIQLGKTSYKVNDRKKAYLDHALKCMEEEKWLRYMSCDGLPDPAALPELNTFLYLWSLEDSTASMKTLPRQCEIVTYLIRMLDEIIECSLQVEPIYLRECRMIRQNFRERLRCYIDMASYGLLRQIEKYTIKVDLKNAKYVERLTPLVCCFWALIRLPISMKIIPDKDKKNVEVTFEEVGLTIKMPLNLNCYGTAIRVLWLGYDHYSDRDKTFHMPEIPEKYRLDMDLLDFCQREYEKLSAIRDEQRDCREQKLEEKRQMIIRILNPSASAEPKGKPERKGKKSDKKKAEPEPEPEIVPLPDVANPEEIILAQEDEMRKETRQLLFTRCKKTEINLRKYAILGGLYKINLINQPPQPKDMRRDIFLTTLQLPKKLELVKFSRPYKAPPPAPDFERTPEVIEAEMKALEAAMEALVLVTLKLPDSVLWFEPPLVAHWLNDEKVWSTEDVHDIKYNEEKQTITFRTGRLGTHGLAAYRFVNLPFQSWELKPEPSKTGGGGVMLSITGAIIQLEFLVREDLVCLHSIVGGGSTALQDMMGKFMKLHTLVLKMRAAGCDFFPEFDAWSYLKGLTLKHPVAGKHLQACMGLLSTAYIFSWSRWNATRSPREIVMQFKEVHGCIAKARPNGILLVTSFQATVVKCSEVSSDFTDQPADENDKFYADVYHYALHNAGIKSRLAMKSISSKLSYTVTKLLNDTNIINFSA